MAHVIMWGIFPQCTLHNDISEPVNMLNNYDAYGELPCEDLNTAQADELPCENRWFIKKHVESDEEPSPCGHLCRTKVYVEKTLRNFSYDGSMFVKIGRDEYFVPCIEHLEVDGMVLIGGKQP